jgi:hypothetical protein
MQRRGASRQPAKGRRTNRPKVRKATIARSSTADLDERVAALTRELKETRDHQMATGEILASLTGSIPDAKPVFQAIVRNLQRLFDTRLAVVQVLKDGIVHLAAAGHEEYETLAKEFPRALDDKTGGSRAIVSKQVVQFAPVLGNPVAPPTTQQFARDLGFNSVIFAPMIRGDQVIGSIFDCSPRVAAIRREGGRAHQGFRRSSRHRHRERPPTQRAASAHYRSDGVAGAADRNLGSAARNLKFRR